MKTTKLLFGIALCALCPILSYAQETIDNKTITTTNDGKTIYSIDFFKPFSPDNAAEMVSHIPGFNIVDGQSIRGLAGTEGNVLIDGARQSTKGQSISQYLSSIPAKSVERIEILQGASLGNLGGSYTILANIIRKSGDKASGSVELGFKTWANEFEPNIEAKYNGEYKGFKINATASSGIYFKEPRKGYEYTWDAANNLIESGPNKDIQSNHEHSLAISTDGEINKAKINANFSFELGKYKRPWEYIAFAPNNIKIKHDKGLDLNKSQSISFGTSIARTIFGFDSKAEFSFQDDESKGENSFGTEFPNAPTRASIFKSENLLREIVTQLSFSKKKNNHSLSFGGEIGRNSLDSEGRFYIGNGVIFNIADNGISKTKVSEIRGELFIADNWTINQKLSLEGKIRAEKSNIKQEGDNEKEREFFYLKPRLALNYKPFDKLNLKASYERKLGQLDFNDFAFQAQIVEGNNTQGNANLEPDKTDEIKLELEKKWGKNGNFTLYLIDRRITDAIGLIPIYENNIIIGETIGNIDSAHRYGGGISSKIPLDKLSKGLEFNIDWNFRNSEIKDPFTKKSREYFFSGDDSYNFDITQNFEAKKLSLTAFFFHGERNVDYRQDSKYLWPNIDYWGLSAEYKGFNNYTIEAELDIPNGLKIERFRTQYLTSREDGNIKNFHYRYRDIEPRFNLSIRKNI